MAIYFLSCYGILTFTMESLMRKKIFSSLVVGLLPIVAYAADIHINNNTNSFGTASFDTIFQVCSSTYFGDRGIMKPKQSDFTISDSVIKKVCGSKNCDALIFDNKNCEGKSIASVTVNANTGIINVKVKSDRYLIQQQSATHLTISEKNSWKNWFKSLF